LIPGGRLVAQCGGHGNITLLAAAAEIAARPSSPRTSPAGADADLRDTGEPARLHAAGFVGVRCWLEPSPVTPDDPVEYLRTITLRDHAAALPAAAVAGFVEEVAGLLGDPVVLDYVRLNIDARRPSSPRDAA
jgi:trans-aconitate 2-methyltransferase